MFFVFQTRYSGWPCGGEWVACIESPAEQWGEPYVEELIDVVTAAGDCDASDASDEIRRRCFMAGGDTPEEALAALMRNEYAMSAARW